MFERFIDYSYHTLVVLRILSKPTVERTDIFRIKGQDCESFAKACPAAIGFFGVGFYPALGKENPALAF
jgi:hypothetical protein